VALRQVAQDPPQLVDLFLDQCERVADLQHDRSVHDVLRRCAPMHVTAGFAALLRHLVNDRKDRVTDDVGLLAQQIEVEGVDVRPLRDLVSRLGRNEAAARLGARERDLDFGVTGDQRMVRKDRAGTRGAERVAKKDRVQHGGRGRGRWGHERFLQAQRLMYVHNNMFVQNCQCCYAQCIPMSDSLYLQVARELTESIRSGRFPVGSRLPTEAELVERFGTSRHTVRAALRELQELGLVTRRKKAGTRVEAAAPVGAYRHSLASVEDLVQFGAAHRRVVRRAIEIVADRALARQIGCAPGRRWLCISSLRIDEDAGPAPVGWTDVYVDPAYAELVDLMRKSPDTLVSALIESRYGRRIAEIRQEIQATLVPAALVDELRVKPRSPALRVVRRYFDPAGELVEASISVHPADRFTFSTRLTRERA
jgi:DNA-binding GntR family transcriptional regulator